MSGGYHVFTEEKRPWREIANDLLHEQETEKIIQLSKELNESLLEDQHPLPKVHEDSKSNRPGAFARE